MLYLKIDASHLCILHVYIVQLYVFFIIAKLQQYSPIIGDHFNVSHFDELMNYLKLNLAKPKATVTSSYSYINELSIINVDGISLDQTVVKFESTVRIWGIKLDSKMN